MEEQNSAGKPKSIFDSLKEKLIEKQKNGSSSNSAVLEELKINRPVANGAAEKPAEPKDTKAISSVKKITGANIIGLWEMKWKKKTEEVSINPEKTAAAPETLASESKVTDFYWNEPFNVYGRMLRKDGAGFGNETVISHFIKLDSIQPSLDDLAANREAIEEVIQEGSEAIIELDCASNRSSEIAKNYKLAKLYEKREAFLHYTGACYVALWIEWNSYSPGQQMLQNGDVNGEDIQNMYNLLIEMARSSFIKHNSDHSRPKDKDSTKEEDIASKDSAKKEDLERMCNKDCPAYDVFQKTIQELVGLFAKQFSEMSLQAIRVYSDTMHSKNMPDLLLSLGSPGLTDPLLKIEYISKM